MNFAVNAAQNWINGSQKAGLSDGTSAGPAFVRFAGETGEKGAVYQMKLLIKHAAVLYGEAPYELLEDACVLVEDSRIAYVGGWEHLPEGPCDREIDGRGALVMPGLVNTHSHVPMVLLRGLGGGLPLQRWLNEKIFPAEAKLDGPAVYWASLLGIAEMLAGGIVSFSDMYFFDGDIARAVADSGIKANLSVGNVCFDRNFRLEELGRFRETEELFDRWQGAGDGRLLVDGGIHAEYTGNPRFVQELSAYFVRKNARVHVHLSETGSEHRECLERHGETPAAYFSRLGAFDRGGVAAHCVWCTDEDLELLKSHGMTVAHCPTSNLKLGSGVAPVPEMLRRGVSVALGTDGAASNDNLNLMEELHIASILHKGVTRDPTVLMPWELVKMATRSGMEAQGRLDSGYVKEGYRADLVLLDVTGLHLTPRAAGLGGLVYAAQASDVRLTMADGKILYDHGAFPTLDLERIRDEIGKTRDRLGL